MYKHASKYMNVVTVDVAHRYEHSVFPFSLVVLVKPRAWSIYRQVFCHWGASPDPDATEEHLQTLNTFLPGAQIQGWLAYSFQLLKLKRSVAFQLIHFVWDNLFLVLGIESIPWTHWENTINWVTVLFPCSLCKFCGKHLTEFPSWTWICLELVMLMHSPRCRWDYKVIVWVCFSLSITAQCSAMMLLKIKQ